MKVIEKGTDRTAYAHITVEGRVNPLEEYGQYVDARDRAICCYVAVEEGDKPRIEGRFSGLTLVVAYDCTVDGVCRKANSYAGKTVQVQKAKKLDVETFLYQMPDGVIDTDMSVIPYTGTVSLNKEACETIGTIELRVYITRQFDIEHAIDDACKYDKVKVGVDPNTQVASFKDVAPQYQMTFEKNCSTFEGPKANREKRKVHAKRPGREPWAIFRFHYRTKESIEASKMELSFDAADKSFAKKEAHALELESVPPLIIGSKPAGKNDGEVSVRTSSPPPPDTPTKGPRKSQSAQPKAFARKQHSKPDTTITTSTSKMASTAATEPATSIEPPVVPQDLLSQLRSTPAKPKDQSSTAAVSKLANDKETDETAPATTQDGGNDLTALTPKKTTKKPAKKATETSEMNSEKLSKEVLKKADKKTDEKTDPESTELNPPTLPVEASNDPTVPHPADLPSVFDTSAAPSTTAPQAIVVPNTKDFVKSSGKGFTSPLKKAVTKPVPIDTTTSTVLQMPVISPAATTPLKRAPEGTLTPPPDVKRIKTDIVPPFTPTKLPRQPTTSPSPQAPSLEAQVAEQRKRLEAMRKKRSEMAKQKAAIDKKLVPYKQRMAEELERLKQETADEEAMMAADEEDYITSEAMLAEFECGDGEIEVVP